MNSWKIVSAIGFFSACIGLYQAFSFNHLPVVNVVYECGGGGDTNVYEFIHELETRSGEVVMLNLHMCASGFARQADGDRIQWDFSEDIVASAGIDDTGFSGTAEDWDRVEESLEERLSVGQVTMNEISSWDNGIPVRLVGIGLTSNPYSYVSVDSEGSDSASGPFQISNQYTNENSVFVISPAPVTDRLGAEVRCARRDWPQWIKFLACPFA